MLRGHDRKQKDDNNDIETHITSYFQDLFKETNSGRTWQPTGFTFVEIQPQD